MTIVEEIRLENLLKGIPFERFILGILYQRDNLLAQRDKSQGLMTFEARDCVKVGIL